MVFYHIQTPLTEFMNSITDREFRLRVAHMRDRKIKPSLTDEYLMQLTAIVDRKFVKNPEKISKNDYLLVPKPVSPESKLSKEEQSEIIKQRTMACLGIPYNAK